MSAIIEKRLLLIVILCCLLWLAGEWLFPPLLPAQQAVITVNGQVTRVVTLQGQEEQIRVVGPHGYDIVEIRGNRVRIVEADCPDKLCIKLGWISRPQQSIVCLPNRIAVRITSSQTAEVDAIAR